MTRICAATHDAEKGLQLFRMLESMGFVEHAEPYNSIIFALASRPRYARKAVEMYRIMQKKRVVPDYHTFTGVLKATSQYGDVPTACEVLETMKNLGFELNEQIYNGLIRTYAGACGVPDVEEQHIEMYVRDAWNLLEQMKEKDIPVNIQILNSILLLHKNALFTQEIHEKVLPLYEKYRIEPDIYTYQNLMQHYSDLNETGLVFQTYDKIKSLEIKPNRVIMQTYLLESMKSKDIDRLVDSLENYEGSEHLPPDRLIRRLSKIPNPPDRLFVALKSLPKQFGTYTEKHRTFEPIGQVPRTNKLMRKGGLPGKKLRKKGF